jgi:LytS/YehU family sensor histidine kinase
MKGRVIGEWFAVFFVLTVIYVLVRPNSKAAQLVSALGMFLRALVKAATDTAK